jgi:hypothetical protein
VAACAVAESVGITAAAAASRAGGPGWTEAVWVVLGGLVEGFALGVAQATLLATVWPRLRTWRYVLVTTLVAGLGWAIGSLPGATSDHAGGVDPPLGLVLLAAAGLGLLMGGLLGGAQAAVLRAVVRHPGRWVGGNAAAWPFGMVVIFAGATRPGEDWPLASVLVAAAATGAAAGAVLGLGLWPWLRAMTPATGSGTAGADGLP